MGAKWYRVIIDFTYKNGMTGGKLDTIVYGKPAIARQLENAEKWLARKGHKEVNRAVIELTRKPERFPS